MYSFSAGTMWREVGEEVVVFAGGIESSNFHFLPPLSPMLLKYRSEEHTSELQSRP